MKKPFYSAIFLIVLVSNSAFSQQTLNCTDAVARLQVYASQVNSFYSAEYWSTIPNQRCPAYDAWGRPYNPVVVQNCRLQMFAYLNNWYGQQCNYVNGLYLQIVRGCTDQSPTVIRKPAPINRKSGSEENEEIDTDEIEELTAGIDEEKAIKITIPKNPTGYRPKQ